MKPDETTRKQLDMAFEPSASDDHTNCAPKETIWAAAAGELPAAQSAELLDHASRCSDCVEAWKLARELSVGSHRAPRRGFPRAGGLALLAAAAMLVLILFTFPRGPQPPVQDPGFRGTSADQITSLIEGRILPRDAFKLRWTPGPEGSIYRLELSTASTPLPSPPPMLDAEFRVPPEWLEQTDAGSNIYWRVRISAPGAEKSASVTFVNVME